MQKDNELITLPTRSVDKLRCSLCKECLSVPPVDLTRKVCGRCNTSKVNCEAYEEIAQYVLFPCIYVKCNEKIAWGKVEEHERNCLHKTFMCPVIDCTEVYEVSLTSRHFWTAHKNLLGHESCPLTINPTNNRNKDKQVFLINGKQLLLVFVFGVPESYPSYTMQYYFGVFALNSNLNNNTKFEVTLITQYTNSHVVSYTQKNQNIIPFDKRDHCLKCIDNKNNCTANYYHKQDNIFLPINFNKVDKNHANVSYQIDIIHSEKKTKKADNKEVSKKMECPICTRYMVSPIYLCDTGHSFCKACKEDLYKCPYCQADIGDRRNFVLEELAETIKVNCINSNNGCKFLGELKLVEDHEDICTHTDSK